MKTDLLATMPLPKDAEAWRQWLTGTKAPEPVIPLAPDAELDDEFFDTGDAK